MEMFCKDCYDSFGVVKEIDQYLFSTSKSLDKKNSPIAALGAESMDLLLLSEVYDMFANKELCLDMMLSKLERVKILLNNFSFDTRMFGGLLELTIVISFVCEKTGHFNLAMLSLKEQLEELILTKIDESEQQINSINVSQYDLIAGLSGVGVYLNLVDSHNAKLLDALINYFKKLCIKNENKYGWFVEFENQIRTNEEFERFKFGHYDCGMAHGIAAPLAILSELYKLGKVDNKEILNILDFYEKIKFVKKDITIYPGKVGPDFKSPYMGLNLSWCYGIPGISMSLIKAYSILGMKEELEATHSNLINICEEINKNDKIINLSTYTLCHGYAGLMCCFNQIFHITHEKSVEKAIKVIRPHIMKNLESIKNNFSVLEGKQGVLLSLLSTIKDSTDYEKLLLIK